MKVEVIAPGGAVMHTATAPRGEQLYIDGKAWPDGPYDARCSTHEPAGLLIVTHLAWYKGDALAKARELAAEAAKADASKPEGFTLKMLAEHGGRPPRREARRRQGQSLGARSIRRSWSSTS